MSKLLNSIIRTPILNIFCLRGKKKKDQNLVNGANLCLCVGGPNLKPWEKSRFKPNNSRLPYRYHKIKNERPLDKVRAAGSAKVKQIISATYIIFLSAIRNISSIMAPKILIVKTFQKIVGDSDFLFFFFFTTQSVLIFLALISSYYAWLYYVLLHYVLYYFC